MRHTPEASSYLHKKSAEILQEARRLAADPRLPQEQTAGQLREAQAFYDRVLQEAAEDAPELIPEAYKEYLALLKEELRAALKADRFEDVEMLGKKMKELKAAYGGETVEATLEEDLIEFLEDNGIVDDVTQHRLRKRAQHLLENQKLSHRAIMEQLKHEFETERSGRTKTPRRGIAV